MSIKKIAKNPLFFIGVAILLLANSGSHPTSNGGYTGAPGDNVCTSCHNGNPNYTGGISIDGVPSTIVASQVYQITVTVSNPNLLANRAGFQITALNTSNAKAGNMANPSSSASLKTSAAKQYFGHAPAVPFSGNPNLTWTVDWTAPASGTGYITFYGATILGNGSGENGDKFYTTTSVGTMMPTSTPLAATIANVTNVSCYNGSDGSATANHTGGVAPYTYLWTSNETSKTATNLSSGIARVTVTDNNGLTTTAQTTITQPTDITVNTVTQTNPTCFNSGNGVLTVSATGGSSGFSYNWSNGATTATNNGLNPGTYMVTVTDVKNCEKTKTFTLTAPPAITIATANVVNQSCQGVNNGSITISASGGTGALKYLWSNGATTASITNLAPLTYNVSISDANNCELVEAYTIQPAPPLNVATSSQSPTCNGGSNGTATATPSGSTGAYTYLWSNGATTATATGLSAGTFTVVVTNASGCSKSSQVVVNQPAGMSSSATSTNASCLGIANGSATATVSGGTSPYAVTWSNGASGTTLNNVVSGTYGYTVTDSKGCTAGFSATIGANSSANLSLTSSTNPACFGGNSGSAVITASNAAGFNITWSNGATGTSVSNLPAGTYTALASNPNGCTSNTLSVEITQPTQITATSENIINVACNGAASGSITTLYSGGTGSLSYVWSNGITNSSIANLPAGSYNLSVTDASSCLTTKTYTVTQPTAIASSNVALTNVNCFGANTGAIAPQYSGGTGAFTYLWNNGATSNNLTNLPTGNYSVSVNDANACQFIQSFVITSPEQINANATITNETSSGANDGKIKASPIGGVAPFTFLWSNGATADSINNLSPGNYSLVITDANGCVKTSSFNIQAGGCALAVSHASSNVSCFGGNNGTITLSPSNGTAPYTFSVPLTNLSAGTYSVVVTDAAGCVFTVSDIVITQPSALNITTDNVTNASSATAADGSISVTVTGGVATYTYEWKDANGNVVSTVEDPKGLVAGSYILAIKDANGCLKSSAAIVVPFTSASNDELLSQIKLYPNPASDQVVVTMPFNNSKLNIIDANGKIVKTVLQKQNSEIIDITSLASGMYIIQILTSDKQLMKVFVKN